MKRAILVIVLLLLVAFVHGCLKINVPKYEVPRDVNFNVNNGPRSDRDGDRQRDKDDDDDDDPDRRRR